MYRVPRSLDVPVVSLSLLGPSHLLASPIGRWELLVLPLFWVEFTQSIFISGWDLKGLATPGTEKPLILSGLINMTQDTLASAHNSSQCLLSIYCVPGALHRSGLEVNARHWSFRDSFHLGGPNNSSPEYPECQG